MQIKARCGLGGVGVLGRLYGNSRGMSVSGSFSEINARIGEVRSAPANGHHQPVCSSPKSAIKGGSRRSHSITAPDVSDELISYYRERKTGEQV